MLILHFNLRKEFKMAIGSIKITDFENLISTPLTKSSITHELTVFFKRIIFFLFKTHQWENNHQLINRLWSDWGSLGDEAKKCNLSAVKKITKKLLLSENSTEDKLRLIHLKSMQKTLNAPAFRLPNNPNTVQFVNQARTGAALLSRSGVSAAGREVFSYLVTQLFLNKPLGIFASLINGPHFELHNSNQFKTLILPINGAEDQTGCKREGAAWANFIVQFNANRIAQGMTPQTKVFLPFVVPGEVRHAILGVVEYNPENPSKANITIIDPFGKNSSYRNNSEAFAEGIKSVFSSPDSKVVFNEVVQQTDGITCGFQQVLNIKDLGKKPDIQNFVEKKGLPARPIEAIQAFIRTL
jgi:hypothetical protein